VNINWQLINKISQKYKLARVEILQKVLGSYFLTHNVYVIFGLYLCRKRARQSIVDTLIRLT